MKRRSFLAGVLAGVAAPAIVRSESLMKIWVPPVPKMWVGVDYGLEPDEIAFRLIPYNDNPELLRVAAAMERRIACEIGQIDRFTVHVSPLSEIFAAQRRYEKTVVARLEAVKREIMTRIVKLDGLPYPRG